MAAMLVLSNLYTVQLSQLIRVISLHLATLPATSRLVQSQSQSGLVLSGPVSGLAFSKGWYGSIYNVWWRYSFLY